MRKFVKKELLGIIRQLDKANEVLMKNANTLSAEQAVNVLTECQQSAIAVGSKVDEIEGEGTATVTLLEEYCEDLYSLSIHWGDVKQTSKTGKHIRLLLNKIGNSIQYDLPDSKKEVVFLPYKASMWDSLESVWMAARDDESCDAYVIPIPYFDKNPDGTFREAHYEGDLYPDYVPIVKYDEYDFKTRRPDVIFIHNPYDEWNHVTSVHPFFYSKNLKQFTEQLVYIPYFVLHEIKMEERIEVDKIKQFVFTPGVIYADKVIVQSEEMKKIYVTEFAGWSKEENLPEAYRDEKYQRGRILALGSPKFDKLFSYCVKKIPTEWESKIGSNKNRKKVIFFNTNVSLILSNNDHFVENLKRIKKIFELYSQAYVVIWREHPLTYETLKAMRPYVLKEYLEFREDFIKNDWVIADDLPDCYTALAISDCYFGAGGSLSALYLATKRPIMITDYKYPNGICDIEVTVETLFATMNRKHYFNERFTNSLALFLGEFEQMREHQLKILDFLPDPSKMKEVNSGKKIYDYCCVQGKENK